jgi:CBS domain-containing membrane protein
MNNLRVRDVMTSEVVTVDHNEKLLVADDIMRLGRIRHILVLDGDKLLVGVLSQRDLFHSGLVKALGYGTHAKQRALDTLVAKEAMVTDLITVTPDMKLAQAAAIMAERKIGCLPVLEGEKLVGILTEGDFVALVAGRKKLVA